MGTNIGLQSQQFQTSNRQWLLSEPKWKANVTLDATKFSANGTNEVQTITVSGSPTGGTLGVLSFGGVSTGDPSVDPTLPYNATAAQVLAAIEGLPYLGPSEEMLYIGVGNVTVTLSGGVYTVTFVGQLAGANMPQLVVTGTALTGGTTPAVATATSTAGQPGIYPNGYIPCGTVLGKVTATGLYGPYNSSASDGTQTAAGILFDDCEVVIPWNNAELTQIGGAMVVNDAVVSQMMLPVQSGPGAIDSGGKTALAQINFQA
jgi:Bacteriophage lambda head decoration protein D